MPSNPHSSTEIDQRMRLAYERTEVKRVLTLLRAQLVDEEYIDEMMSASELLDIRQKLYVVLEQLRSIGSQFAKAEKRPWDDEELKNYFGI